MLNMMFSGVQSYQKRAMAERQAAYETQTETETEPDIKVAKNTETVAAKWTS